MSTDADVSAANRRGMIAMVLAMACFVSNDTLTKLAAEAAPTSQIMTVRGLFASFAVLVLVVAVGQTKRIPRLLEGAALVRALLEALTAGLFLVALAHVSLGMITAILQVAPLALTALSVVLLKESVGWRRWLAVAAGFVGVLIIVRPGPEGLDPYAMIALACAITVAFREISTRHVSRETPTLVLTLGTTLAVVIFGAFGLFIEDWKPLDTVALIQLAAAGILVAAGNWLILTAYRGTEVSAVGPFRYSVVVFALVLGYFVFDEVPDTLALIGTAIVVGSGLYAAHREIVRRRQIIAGMVASPDSAGR